MGMCTVHRPGQARDQRGPVSGKRCDLNSGTALTLVIVVCVVALAALIALGLVLHRSAGLLKAHDTARDSARDSARTAGQREADGAAASQAERAPRAETAGSPARPAAAGAAAVPAVPDEEAVRHAEQLLAQAES